MDVGNLPPFIKTPFWVNLSDMDHIARQSTFLEVIAKSLHKPIDNVTPVLLYQVVFFIGQDW